MIQAGQNTRKQIVNYPRPRAETRLITGSFLIQANSGGEPVISGKRLGLAPASPFRDASISDPERAYHILHGMWQHRPYLGPQGPLRTGALYTTWDHKASPGQRHTVHLYARQPRRASHPQVVRGHAWTDRPRWEKTVCHVLPKRIDV